MRTCTVEGCEKRHFGKGWCNMHYSRMRAHGTLDTPAKKKCSIDGCDNPSRKLGMCGKHHSRVKRNGSPHDVDQSWVLTERGDCIVCGTPVPEGIGFRRYCGSSCAATRHTNRDRLKTKTCAQCGEEFSLTERSPRTGKLRYSSASTCTPCGKPSNLRRYVVKLVERDGANCGICGLVVDTELAYPDEMSPSVDHVIPRSLGGPDRIGNFRLSHLICNVRRQNRIDDHIRDNNSAFFASNSSGDKIP